MAPGPRPLRCLSRAIAAACAVSGAALALFAAAPAGAAAEAPDFQYFKQNVEPVLQSVCAQCHAGKGKGRFALIVHGAGVPFPDEEHRRNFETVSALLVPGNPEKSLFLLKPLAVRDGGVKHEGGDRIFKGTPAYRTWTGFINGEKAGAPAMPAAGATGRPDFGFFLANVEPVLLGTCSRCHAGAGKGQFALIVHVGGTRFPLDDHRKNFETVSRLLVPGKPDQSKFLLKPLAEKDGGVKHGGGDLITKGDANYRNWTEFISGVVGPPPPEEKPEEVLPTVSDKGLSLEVAGMKLSGDATLQPAEGVEGTKRVAAAGAGGGRATAVFRTGRTGSYRLVVRGVGAGRALRLRVDGGEPMTLELPATPAGVVEVSPRLPLDGGAPLDARRGRLVVDGTTLRMDGREGSARFLTPADLAHKKVEAVIALPAADDPARDDAWLLFDCQHGDSGKFFGLVDAGRKVVMGVIEDGRPRVLTSVPRPDALPGTRLTVKLVDGIAVGVLDGKSLLKVNFDRGLGAGRFGFLTHGVVQVTDLRAWMEAEEVYAMKVSEGGVVTLHRGPHTLDVDLLPGGAALESVSVQEAPK